jgi:hypothetical protein
LKDVSIWRSSQPLTGFNIISREPHDSDMLKLIG